MPVFSFEKIRGADIALGPEMKSTGECLGIAKTFNEALYKAFLGAGINLPKYKNMIITVKDEDKEDIVPIAQIHRVSPSLHIAAIVPPFPHPRNEKPEKVCLSPCRVP